MFGRDIFGKMDIILIGAVFVAVAFGIMMIYSAGFDPVAAINKGFYKKQIIWFKIGIIFPKIQFKY